MQSIKSLHHYHVFILFNNRSNRFNTHFIWCGKFANVYERNFATELLGAQVLFQDYWLSELTTVFFQGYPNVTLILEGPNGSDEFWKLIQGSPEDIPYYYPDTERFIPRLFQCKYLIFFLLVKLIVVFRF
jgi:hypothetical protein